ncbi:hypothetical protein L596_026631 [Steinernema carpocapsae]|uniref:Glycylpeptide N-tetradecanoyltransferase n=1 Tax=Steinernema carpocapsae TaxID=34508 RepID=A0A4U5M1Z9_STECR|nr:hypothetical protein L596_026631 [Steinernema carpocapsae]
MTEHNNAIKDLIAQVNLLRTEEAKSNEEFNFPQHEFWNTQPVPELGEVIKENTAIQLDIDPESVRAEPYSLPANFVWNNVDVDKQEELNELYELLNQNYVGDGNETSRLNYSRDFLNWALTPPGHQKHYHFGVRVASKADKKGRLVGFIAGVPATIRVYDKTVKMLEINFLCVHKKLRSKRLTPVLIKELTRRANRDGIFQAAYTAGIVIPKPIAECRFYHRQLDVKKLVECQFSILKNNETLARRIKLNQLPVETSFMNLKPLDESHLDSALELLTTYLNQFKLTQIFTREEFAHNFLPRDNVIYSFVVETSGKVTDFISFYSLPTNLIGHKKHKEVRGAYSYYNVATSVPPKDLIQDALILAKQESFDVYNALNLMEFDTEFLEELKFLKGSGYLQYYLYNWKCPDMQPEEVGLVLQ